MIKFLVDTSWILFRGYWAFPQMKNPQGEPNGHLFALTNTLKSLETFQDCKIYLCMDGNAIHRKLESRDYKSNRQRAEFNLDKDVIDKLVADLPNVVLAYNPVAEADDVIFSIPRTENDKEAHYVVYSGDADQIQGMRDNITISKNIKKDHIEPIERFSDWYVNKFKSVPPERLPIYRAMTGDVSDALKPPVPRFQKILAEDITMKFKTTEPSKEELIEIAKDYIKTTKYKLVCSLIDNYDKFQSNYDLMRLKVIDYELAPKDWKEGVSQRIAQEQGLWQYLKYLQGLETKYNQPKQEEEVQAWNMQSQSISMEQLLKTDSLTSVESNQMQNMQ